MNVSIYALCDPDTNEIRYIGRVSDVDRRYRQHLSTEVHEWVVSLLAQNKTPVIKILSVVPESEANDAERNAI